MAKKKAIKPRHGRRPVRAVVSPAFDETTFEPLAIDKHKVITLAGREFVAVKHLDASQRLWSWQLEDGSLCWFPAVERKQLLADGKPSPGAKLVRVRIVKSW